MITPEQQASMDAIDSGIADTERAEFLQKEEEAAQWLRENNPEMKPPDRNLGQQVVEVGKELNRAAKGGLRDTVSSMITTPERFKDMFSGEMERQGAQYKPSFDPLGSLDYRTATWWGEIASTVVHYGSMAATLGVGASGATSLSGTLAAASRATPTLVKSGLIGAGADLLSEYNQDANLLATLRDRFGFIDTPLSTKDTDHPAIKTVKQVVEGFGIGGVVDRLVSSIGKAAKNIRTPKGKAHKPDRAALEGVDKINEVRRSKAEDAAKSAVDGRLRIATAQNLFRQGIDFEKLDPVEQIGQMVEYKKAHKGQFETWTPPVEDPEMRATRKSEERTEDVYEQQVEMAQLELDLSDDFTPYANKPIADIQQGNAFSRGSAYDVAKQSKRIALEYGAEMGSTDNIITPAAAERIADNGFGDKSVNQLIAKQLYGDERLQLLMDDLRLNGKNPDEVFNYAEQKAYEILNAREVGESTPKEFFRELFMDQNVISDEAVWKAENVVAADLINTALFTKLRDLAVVSREMFDYLDVADVGGPIDHIRNNLIVGLTETKRARYLLGSEFRKLQRNSPEQAAVRKGEALKQIHESTRGQVDMMLEMARKAPTDDFLRAVVEAFSMSNSIHNWIDFDNFMTKKLLGETTEAGVKKTGSVIRELQGVMVNSVLSGPKTPLRAIMGTSTATFLKPMSQLIGGAVQYVGSGFNDPHTMRSALAQLHSLAETVPEATKYFFSRLNSYWAGDLSTYKSRFAEYDPRDDEWALLSNWAEERGTIGDKIAFGLANIARSANQTGFLTYSSKLMAATDDAFTLMMARARAKQKAIDLAFSARKDGTIPEITPALIKEIEAREYAEIFDPATGAVSDKMLDVAKKEATLTTELGALGRGMDALFDTFPPLKPFYLFGRTGINGMKYTFKHAPIVNAFQKEVRDIYLATPENLDKVRIYGIETPEELANAKAIVHGRVALGSAVAFMAGQSYLKGGFTGNGPQSEELRRTWEATGWKPRSIKVGDAWISYDSLEPFNNILAAIADAGDNARLMGPEWQEQGMAGVAFAIARGMTSKTYMQGIQMLVDVVSNPAKLPKIAASMANNQVPLSSLRNEMGRLINPAMRELSSSWHEQIRNRNLISESLTDDPLPIKYDILNGEPIRDWDPFTRIFNMISPVQLNMGDSPGRTLLRNSNYDMRMSVYTSPGEPTIDLSDEPKIRSRFQQAIGKRNLEKQLNKLADDPEIQESIAQMNRDRDMPGGRGIDPMTYPHNDKIKFIIERARSEAWGEIRNDPDVVQLEAIKLANIAAGRLRGMGETERAQQQQEKASNLLEIYR